MFLFKIIFWPSYSFFLHFLHCGSDIPLKAHSPQSSCSAFYSNKQLFFSLSGSCCFAHFLVNLEGSPCGSAPTFLKRLLPSLSVICHTQRQMEKHERSNVSGFSELGFKCCRLLKAEYDLCKEFVCFFRMHHFVAFLRLCLC